MFKDVTSLMNPFHTEAFQSTAEELLLHGGANAGKSYTTAQKIAQYPAVNRLHGIKKDLKALVVRKTYPSLKATCMEMIKNECKKFGIQYSLNEKHNIAQIENMQIIYRSCNNEKDIEKIKSLTDIDIIWIEELTEIREEDYKQIMLRLRGGRGLYAQCISTFNPVGKTSWVYKRFWERNIGDAHKIRYTVLHNPWATEREINRLKATKLDDENFYKIYFLGEWGELRGKIYNWDIVPFPKDISFDEIFYGGDFGFSVDPTAVPRIYRKSNHFWLGEVLYDIGLTNPQIAVTLKDRGVRSDEPSYWDSAEPKSIKELQTNGIYAQPAIKGPDSVRAGIDFLQSQHIHIIEGSVNIIKEHNSYIWKKDSRTGESIKVPISINNHFMDAIRYGIYSHMRGDADGYAEQTDVEAY